MRRRAGGDHVALHGPGAAGAEAGEAEAEGVLAELRGDVVDDRRRGGAGGLGAEDVEGGVLVARGELRKGDPRADVLLAGLQLGTEGGDGGTVERRGVVRRLGERHRHHVRCVLGDGEGARRDGAAHRPGQ